MGPPAWLPQEIWEIIVFDYCPDALHEFLQTSIDNYFASDVKNFVYPSCRFNALLKNYDTETLFFFLCRLRYFNQLIKKEKRSHRFLKTIGYKDFPKVQKRLYSYSVSNFFGLIKPIVCSKQRTPRSLTELASSSRT
jgi:hypothetical protein